MSADNELNCVTTEPFGVGGAVGMGQNHWFVALVKQNTEKSSKEKLTRLGYYGSSRNPGAFVKSGRMEC